MPVIKFDSLQSGDVLAESLAVNGVTLFEAGTVLLDKHLELLKMLGVETATIDPRRGRTFESLNDVFANIDRRFSYVEDDRLMMSVKYLVKDIITSMEYPV